MLTDPYTYYCRILTSSLNGCDSVLDVGCGPSSPLCNVSGNRRQVGVDADPDAVLAARHNGSYSQVIQMDILDILEHFGPASFDAAIALDVIEHFERDQGEHLLQQLDMITRNAIVVVTPNGFQPQASFDGNNLQEHRSGWTRTDFENKSYHVTGIRGLRILRGERATPRVKPAKLGWRLSSLSQHIVTNRPDLAFQLYCLKRK